MQSRLDSSSNGFARQLLPLSCLLCNSGFACQYTPHPGSSSSFCNRWNRDTRCKNLVRTHFSRLKCLSQKFRPDSSNSRSRESLPARNKSSTNRHTISDHACCNFFCSFTVVVDQELTFFVSEILVFKRLVVACYKFLKLTRTIFPKIKISLLNQWVLRCESLRRLDFLIKETLPSHLRSVFCSLLQCFKRSKRRRLWCRTSVVKNNFRLSHRRSLRSRQFVRFLLSCLNFVVKNNFGHICVYLMVAGLPPTKILVPIGRFADLASSSVLNERASGCCWVAAAFVSEPVIAPAGSLIPYCL